MFFFFHHPPRKSNIKFVFPNCVFSRKVSFIPSQDSAVYSFHPCNPLNSLPFGMLCRMIKSHVQWLQRACEKMVEKGQKSRQGKQNPRRTLLFDTGKCETLISFELDIFSSLHSANTFWASFVCRKH